MNDPERDSDWLHAELQAERARTAAPDGARERVSAALASRMSLGLGVPEPVGASRSMRTLVSTLALGAALGVVGTKLFWPSAQIVPSTQPASTVQRAPAVAGSESTVPAALPPTAPAPALRSLPRLDAPAVPANASAAERLLLDPGRVALAEGDFDRTLAAAARHATRFPQGALAEEREALAIKALTRSGQIDAARARFDRFQRAFPASPQRSSLAAELPAGP